MQDYPHVSIKFNFQYPRINWRRWKIAKATSETQTSSQVVGSGTTSILTLSNRAVWVAAVDHCQ